MTTEHHVDAKGLKCPMPVIQLQKMVRKAESGDSVIIEYTDKNALRDIQSWCHINGHQFLGEHPKPSDTSGTQEVLAILIQVK